MANVRLAAAGLLALAGGGLVSPPVVVRATEQLTFRSAVKTVAVYPTVRDREGRLVVDLARDEFVVLDNGKPADVTVFSNDVQAITVAVMLDMSGSMNGKLLRLRNGTCGFVDALEAGDRARIGSFGDEVALSPHLTGDKALLKRVISDELWPGGGTPLWQAMYAAMTSLADQHGRRVVLVLTDGIDNTSNVSFGTMERRALDEGFMVYAIGMEGPGLSGDLAGLSEKTGGGHYDVPDAADLAETFARVADELRHSYVVGFTPSALDGKTHKLELRVTRAGTSVRAAKSYLAAADK